MNNPFDALEIKQDLVLSYDSDAAARDERGEPDWRDEHREFFAATMRAEDKTRLLEIGAGSGHSAAFFVAEGFAVIATDLSPGNVARCRAKGLDARVGDFYDLDFPDDSFEAIWAMSCLMHAPDADGLLNNGIKLGNRTADLFSSRILLSTCGGYFLHKLSGLLNIRN